MIVICCLNIYLEKLLNPDRLWSNVWPLVEVSDFERFGVVHLEDDHDNMLEYDLAGTFRNKLRNSKMLLKIEWKLIFEGGLLLLLLKLVSRARQLENWEFSTENCENNNWDFLNFPTATYFPAVYQWKADAEIFINFSIFLKPF